MGKNLKFDHPVTCGNCGATTEGKMERCFFDKPGDVLSRRQVIALAAAIHRGDCAEAAIELDLLFRDEPDVLEWIAQARTRRAA